MLEQPRHCMASRPHRQVTANATW